MTYSKMKQKSAPRTGDYQADEYTNGKKLVFVTHSIEAFESIVSRSIVICLKLVTNKV